MDLFTFCISFAIVCCLFLVLTLAFEHGYLDHFESVIQLKRMAKTVFGLLDIWLASQRKKVEVNVAHNKSKLSISISYTIHGQKALINVPYNRTKASRMKMWNVFLIPKQGNPIPITQPTGIPYMCSARMLGGEEIMAIHKLNSTNVRSFGIDIVPTWLEISN